MRALVLSGGGSRGAPQAGAIEHLLKERGIHYDIITGVSVGALNGSFISMFKKGEEKAAAEGLREIWYTISDDKVFGKWYKGVVGTYLPFLWKGSLFHTKPLQKLVRGTLDLERVKGSGKQLRVGAVSLERRDRRVWDQNSPLIAEAVLASAAFPPVFEPIPIEGDWYVDDGLQETMMIKDAIDAGATHLDIIECSTPGGRKELKKRPSGVEVAKRCIDAQKREVRRGDLLAIDLYNALIKEGSPKAEGKRLLTYNHLQFSKLDLESSIDFTNEKAKRNYQHGLEKARTMSWDIVAP